MMDAHCLNRRKRRRAERQALCERIRETKDQLKKAGIWYFDYPLEGSSAQLLAIEKRLLARFNAPVLWEEWPTNGPDHQEWYFEPLRVVSHDSALRVYYWGALIWQRHDGAYEALRDITAAYEFTKKDYHLWFPETQKEFHNGPRSV